MALLKKKPKDTTEKRKHSGLTNFIDKAKEAVPAVGGLVVDVVTGNWREALKNLWEKLNGVPETPEIITLKNELRIKEIDFVMEMARIDAADRDSARNMAIEEAKVGKKDIVRPMLAAVAVLAFGFIVYVISFRTIAVENRELFVHVLGIIEGAMLVNVFQFYFGSSASSVRKTELLNKVDE